MTPYEEATPRALAGGDPRRVQEAACSLVERAGLLFRPGSGAKTFPLDAVPRVLPADEWDRLEQALDRFDELVIKPRAGSGGRGVMVCPHAERAEVDELREQVRAEPEQWVAQSLVDLSTHATLIDGELAPRHVDLRPFVFMHGPDDPHVMPGGLTRYAVEEGAVVVNSTQNGGFKDTWVLGR